MTVIATEAPDLLADFGVSADALRGGRLPARSPITGETLPLAQGVRFDV